MKAERLAIPDVILVEPARHADPRGFFSETWSAAAYAELGIGPGFVQDNHSRSSTRGVIRGLHLQIGPNAQGKLVRVVRGAIWDVAVDVRRGSPSYGRHVAAVLTRRTGPALGAAGVPARVLHDRARHRGDLQGHRAIRPARRARSGVE